MNALAYQADPSSVTTEKASPQRVRITRGVSVRAVSVHSNLDPWCGSSTTLSSTNSSMTVGSETGNSTTLNPDTDLLSVRSRCSSRSSRHSNNSC